MYERMFLVINVSTKGAAQKIITEKEFAIRTVKLKQTCPSSFAVSLYG